MSDLSGRAQSRDRCHVRRTKSRASQRAQGARLVRAVNCRREMPAASSAAPGPQQPAATPMIASGRARRIPSTRVPAVVSRVNRELLYSNLMYSIL